VSGVRFSYTIEGDVSDQEQKLIDAVNEHMRKRAADGRALKLRAVGQNKSIGLVFTVTDNDGNVIQEQAAELRA